MAQGMQLAEAALLLLVVLVWSLKSVALHARFHITAMAQEALPFLLMVVFLELHGLPLVVAVLRFLPPTASPHRHHQPQHFQTHP
jgi:hypothetical protein